MHGLSRMAISRPSRPYNAVEALEGLWDGCSSYIRRVIFAVFLSVLYFFSCFYFCVAFERLHIVPLAIDARYFLYASWCPPPADGHVVVLVMLLLAVMFPSVVMLPLTVKFCRWP